MTKPNGSVGSAGRVRRFSATPLLEIPVFCSDLNSYCIYCGQWYFGQALQWCPRCDGAIFRHVPKDDLRLFSGRSPLSSL